MQVSGRVFTSALILLLFGGGAAAGQQPGTALLVPLEQGIESESPRPRLEFRAPEGDLRRPGDPRRNGLIAAFPLRENVEIGVGRFSVAEIARPRTNMEADRHSTAVRTRDRGIAAVGLSIRF